MIKFFRKIRYKLMNENKTSKYFTYALGEIILVVIGILIALQINNWNENRKERMLENQFLLNLEEDVNAQLKELDLQIDQEVAFIKTANKMLNNFRTNSRIEVDSSFSKNLLDLTARRTFKIYNPTFTELLSSGQVSLLTDPELKNTVVAYYQELMRFEKIVQNNNLYLTDQNFVPTSLKLGNYLEKIDEYQQSDSTFIDLFTPLSVYDPKLAKISTNLLNESSNLLLLINNVKMRHGSSTSLLNLSINLKKETLKLQSLLKQSHD